ncbi:hypothetical protein [Neotamlana laminarinivorans]|uniref:DUF4374 domain-containing protein n=1 Tax=Neotamlana laminarinivorans TaxID=2883124 RepID=A0A9X1L1Q5_9FLAO|nr:hypothetical protein [Tamlana laminarinivorans]MCB4798945.1 hypothetical protein [Tamlana laminarinivorans]
MKSKINNLLKTNLLILLVIFGLSLTSCDSNDDGGDPTPSAEYPDYLVGAAVDGEGYFLTTDNITSGNLTIVGNGYEGWSNISASVDGYLYVINNTEGLTEKFELTENGPVKVDAISNAVLTAGGFFRYIQATDNGDLFLSSNPNGDGYTPYAIIDIETFAATSSGFISFPTVGEKVNLWSNALVENGKIYFGSLYGNSDWTGIEDELYTVVYDYPSLTNAQIITSSASAGMTAGYRTNGTFATETGDIYQYNITSELWYGHDEVADESSVFVKIANGDYDDDYVLDVSSFFSEPISIWNAWYAADGIAYANVIRNADVPEWGDLSQNTGTLVEIDLINQTVTELNLPDASFVNIFTLDCVEDDKFYIPVSVTGGDAHIYEITIGGGANAFSQGAALDGSNVYVNSLLKN